MSALNRDILERMPGLERYARSLTKNSADAEDLVQDCIERALTKHSQFRAGTNLNAWLMTIMRHIFLNSMRQNMRHEQILQQQGTLAASVGDQSTSPSQLGYVELRDVVRACGNLRKHHQRAIELFVIKQCSHKEAADAMGVSITTAKTRLFRAREKLRHALAA